MSIKDKLSDIGNKASNAVVDKGKSVVNSAANSAMNNAASIASKAQAAWKKIQATVKVAFRATVSFIKTFIALVTSPFTWISIGIVIAIIGTFTLFQTFGKDEVTATCDSESAASTVNISGGSLQGNDDAKTVIAALSNPGSYGAPTLQGKFGKVQIAAILGNFTIESGVHFNATYQHAHDGDNNDQIKAWQAAVSPAPIGLAQWTPGRSTKMIDLATQNGKRWNDGEIQMKYLLSELSGSYNASLDKRGFWTATDLKAATSAFQDVFEVPALPGTAAADAELTKRFAKAQEAMTSLGGSTTVSTSSCVKGDNSSPRFGSIENPGIKPDDWDKASNYAKAVVNTAISFVSDDKLYYDMGAGPGGYDCSAFVTTVIELSTGYTYGGTKVTKNYDPKQWFETRTSKSKMDLQEAYYTGTMMKELTQSSKAYIGMSTDPGIESKILPGDVFVNSVHTKFYAGHRASDNKIVWVQSSCHNCNTIKFKDVATQVKRADMGVSVSDGVDGGTPGKVYEIYRPYAMYPDK
jgi:hypothetical protein